MTNIVLKIVQDLNNFLKCFPESYLRYFRLSALIPSDGYDTSIKSEDSLIL